MAANDEADEAAAGAAARFSVSTTVQPNVIHAGCAETASSESFSMADDERRSPAFKNKR